MNDKEYAVFDALTRINTFGGAYAAQFAAGSAAASDFARVPVILGEIGTPGQQSGSAASPATLAKAQLFEEVRDDLEAIAATARTIAIKQPGFATSFRLGDDSQRQILADADTFLKALAEPGVADLFIHHSMDPDFIQDLKADLALIEAKDDGQDEDQQDSAGDTARVRALIKEARTLIKSLHTSVKNRFRRDPEILAKWQTASHIQRSPRNREETSPPPPPAPPAAP